MSRSWRLIMRWYLDHVTFYDFAHYNNVGCTANSVTVLCDHSLRSQDLNPLVTSSVHQYDFVHPSKFKAKLSLKRSDYMLMSDFLSIHIIT